MAKTHLSGFSIFMIAMVLLALLGVALTIFGTLTYTPAPTATPWTVAGCIRNG